MTLVAHLTDLHFGGPPDARGRADRVLDHVWPSTRDPTCCW